MASFLSLQPRPVLGHRGQRQPVKVAAQAAVEQHRQTAAQPKTVTAPVRYVKPPPPGETLYQYVYDLPEGVDEPDNVHHLSTQVSITDLRQLSTNFSILEQGFQLVPFAVPLDIDWDSTEQVESRYYPLAADFLKQFSGAFRVHIFDHTLRKGKSRSENAKPGEELEPANTPVSRVHTDYTTQGGVNRLKALLPDEAERLSKTPFAVYQMWRPLRSVVQESPLGFIDASSLDNDDLHVHRIEFPGRTGYNYSISPNPNHRWYYTRHMKPDEAYVFVEYESRKGRARFTPHTGFRDPTTPPDAPMRESVELRAMVFWEHEPPQAPELEL